MASSRAQKNRSSSHKQRKSSERQVETPMQQVCCNDDDCHPGKGDCKTPDLPAIDVYNCQKCKEKDTEISELKKLFDQSRIELELCKKQNKTAVKLPEGSEVESNNSSCQSMRCDNSNQNGNSYWRWFPWSPKIAPADVITKSPISNSKVQDSESNNPTIQKTCEVGVQTEECNLQKKLLHLREKYKSEYGKLQEENLHLRQTVEMLKSELEQKGRLVTERLPGHMENTIKHLKVQMRNLQKDLHELQERNYEMSVDCNQNKQEYKRLDAQLVRMKMERDEVLRLLRSKKISVPQIQCNPASFPLDPNEARHIRKWIDQIVQLIETPTERFPEFDKKSQFYQCLNMLDGKYDNSIRLGLQVLLFGVFGKAYTFCKEVFICCTSKAAKYYLKLGVHDQEALRCKYPELSSLKLDEKLQDTCVQEVEKKFECSSDCSFIESAKNAAAHMLIKLYQDKHPDILPFYFEKQLREKSMDLCPQDDVEGRTLVNNFFFNAIRLSWELVTARRPPYISAEWTTFHAALHRRHPKCSSANNFNLEILCYLSPVVLEYCEGPVLSKGKVLLEPTTTD